jgi:hypothetical protein
MIDQTAYVLLASQIIAFRTGGSYSECMLPLVLTAKCGASLNQLEGCEGARELPPEQALVPSEQLEGFTVEIHDR